MASSDSGRRKQSARAIPAGLSVEQLAAVLRVASDAIVVQRVDESVVFANAAAARYTAHTADEALEGMSFERLIAGFETFDEAGEPWDPAQWPARRVIAGEGESDATVCLRSRTDGAEHWAHVTSTAMPDGKGAVEFVVTVLRDVTSEKRALAALQSVQQTVAHKAEELASAVRIRDEFLSIASHELKTPLTSLQLNIDMLVRSVQTGDPLSDEKVVSLMDAAQRQHRRLARLVNELLDVSRIASGRLRLEPEPFDLVQLARDVCSRFQSEVDALGASLTLRGDDEIVGHWDRLRIEQVVTHLVSNAVRYGRRGPIEVVIERDDDKARVTVTDKGIGIAPEACERIFGRFERAASARNYGGLGLGLYIVRQIVEAHGGTIAVASRPGEGSTFTVELPADSRRTLTSA